MTKLQLLIEMHTYRRPMGSGTERAFIDRFIKPLPGAWRDSYRNWHVTVGPDIGEKGASPVLWSSHTDTVHYDEGRQDVTYRRKTGMLTLAHRELRSNCLGADCTAGVFLMHEMILAGVPGHYVFHYGEERGGQGSRKLALKCADWLSQFQFAIALDRSGTCDVITHQSFGRSASDAFAKSMAKQLGGYYKPCDGGIYTDTAEYADIIPECSNISVGYTRAHSEAETLDTRHLFNLLRRLLKFDWRTLVAARDLRAQVQPLAWWEQEEFQEGGLDDYKYLPNWYRDDDPDFLDAESVERVNGDSPLLDPRDRAYLDPLWGEVQRELEKQLKTRRPS